jgi:putative PIN family toxin of toxin-antitoxin system
MQRIVLDTNCLLISLPRISPYHIIWQSFLQGRYALCVSSDIVEEYLEIITQKTNERVANNVVSAILNAPNTEYVTPYYRFNLITKDYDDNKFVDCCISSNASYIVTNDHHFDVLKGIKFPRVNVINAMSFVKEI